MDSGPHAAEKPLILHPELDSPEDHVIFLKYGGIKGISNKGETTVKVCKLERDELVMARKGLIDKFFRSLLEPLYQYSKGTIDQEILKYELDKIFRKMQHSFQPHQSYSRVGWYVYHQFETFLLPRFGSKVQNLLKKAYATFRRKGTCR